MKIFLKHFFGIMDQKDKVSFRNYLIILFFLSPLSIIGIGAIIPFINILIQPKLITKYSYFDGWEYSNLILMFSILLIIAFFIKNIVSFLMLRYQFSFLFNFTSKIQKKLFNKYLLLPYEYHLSKSTPDLIKNINNETSILSLYVVAPFGNFLTEFISSFFVLSFLLTINFFFSISIIFFLGASIILLIRATKIQVAYHSKLRSVALSEMTNSVISGLETIKELKIYHKEHYFLDNFDHNSNALSHSSSFQLVFQQSSRLMIEFLGVFVVIGIMCFYILNGIKPDELFILLGVFGVAAAQLLPSINRLTQAIAQIKYGMLSLEIIYKELLELQNPKIKILPIACKAPPLVFNKKIEIKGLTHVYPDGTVALKNICLSIAKGDKIALVGKSGSGKTSLVDCLLGLYSFNNSEIWVDDNCIDSEKDHYSLQKLFGYIPQTINLYNKTVAENIAFGVKSDEIDYKNVWSCLRKARLDDFICQLADQENTIIGEKGIKLSGGQRQRIGIARALYQQPQILIMDEATSALDNITEKEIMEMFDQLNDITIIAIAHRLSTIKNYNVVYILKDGEIVDQGTYQSLINSSDYFKKNIIK